MKLEEFDFDLPERLIARFPAHRRDESRLMVVDRTSGRISHHRFKEIIELIAHEEFLVVNNSRVVPARLLGRIGDGTVEVLLTGTYTLRDRLAEVLTKPARRFRHGVEVHFDDNLSARVKEVKERGRRILEFNRCLEDVLAAGYAPLPPYIKRKGVEARQYRDFDLERYQTVYARDPGSIAAPTAGLHFSPELLDQLRQKTDVVPLTLDVGEATFRTIETEDIEDHRMGAEVVRITSDTQERIKELRERKRLVAVGTTSVRSLETFALLSPVAEEFVSELFIYPGFRFRLVDRLITNFHLPRSSLFILVCAFAGIDLMKKAYGIAVNEEYRFFSYGDAMLIR